MACKMWFGFQFNLSDSSDDGLYRLDLDPEGQGHQWKMISIQLGSYFGAPKKKSSRGYLRVRPDANADADADANGSKTICRPPLKGVDITTSSLSHGYSQNSKKPALVLDRTKNTECHQVERIYFKNIF